MKLRTNASLTQGAEPSIIDGRGRYSSYRVIPIEADAMPVFKINAMWDQEASVWVATSDDVPGLVTEAESCEALITKLKILIPELLAENGVFKGDVPEVPFELLSHRVEHTAKRYA